VITIVHVSIRPIVVHGLRRKAVAMPLAVWMTWRVDGLLMLRVRRCLVVVGLIVSIRLTK